MNNFNLNEEQLKGFQKVVKYAALALAIILSVSIIVGILSIAGAIFGIHGTVAVGDMRDYKVEGDVVDFDLDISAAELKIVCGDRFEVRSNLKNLKVNVSGGCLKIEEKTKIKIDAFGNGYNDAYLEITLPSDFVFGKVDIDTGAGKVDIERLFAEKIEMSLGAGQVTVEELSASAYADIDGGAGQLNIHGGTLKNLDFDMGLGELNFTASLLGECDFDMGVGRANLTLLGSPDDYRIEFSKGLGSIDFNGDDIENGQIIGNGDTKIDIDGGIGAINVKTTN